MRDESSDKLLERAREYQAEARELGRQLAEVEDSRGDLLWVQAYVTNVP